MTWRAVSDQAARQSGWRMTRSGRAQQEAEAAAAAEEEPLPAPLFSLQSNTLEFASNRRPESQHNTTQQNKAGPGCQCGRVTVKSKQTRPASGLAAHCRSRAE